MLLLLVIIISCSKDSSNNSVAPIDSSDGFLWIHVNNDSVKAVFSDLAKIDADGEEAIQLSSFVDTTLVSMYKDKNDNQYDSRKLYSYEISADDGFSASKKGYSNNTWEQIQLGHIITETRRVVFPDDKIDLPSAYNVKETRHVHLNRKFDVISPDTTAFYELENITTVSITNFDGQLEDAYALKDFVLPFVSTPENNHFNIKSIDDYGPSSDLTWQQFQSGYWLVSSQKTMFTDTTLAGGSYKLKVLEKILVK